jgi:hypothetical protein
VRVPVLSVVVVISELSGPGWVVVAVVALAFSLAFAFDCELLWQPKQTVKAISANAIRNFFDTTLLL